MKRFIALAVTPALMVGAALGAASLAGAQGQGTDTRVPPRSVTFTVTPKKDSTGPYRFRVRGRVGVPADNQLPPQARGCPPGITDPNNPYCRPQRERACENGRVAIRYKTGKKTLGNTISLRRARLRNGPSNANPWFCRFSSRVRFGNPDRFQGERLKVTVRFLGNAVLRPRSARSRIVRVELPN